jgi:hypothetical protein
MKTPQVTPPWATGIYIGNGVVAKPKTQKIPKAFVDYVYSFYGRGGIYDMGALKRDIQQATRDYLNKPNCNFDAPNGDSLDRENVRDILIADYGYKFP